MFDVYHQGISINFGAAFNNWCGILNRRHVLKNQFYFLNVKDEMLRMNRRCRLAGVDLIFDLCFMYRLQTGTTPGILVIINFLTGQFISFRVFSSLNQMYILENKFFKAFNFTNIC